MKTDIAELIKQASEAAKNAPEHLQEAAFNKAFEALLAASQERTSGAASTRKKARPPRGAGGPSDLEDSKATLDELDRTAHTDINHDDTALNNSLRLLFAAKEDLGIDGLTAPAIARTLVDKFRCRISIRAVSLALNGAGRYVHRHKEGNTVVFRIMGPGEHYLETLATGGEPSRPKPRRKARTRKKPSASAKKANAETATTSKKDEKASPSRRGSSGPATELSKLYDADFFASPQTIGNMIERLKHDLGRTFRPNELSPLLLRWLRNGRLTRSMNSDNQYEYKRP